MPQLTDYIKIYKHVFTDNDCDTMLRYMESNYKWERHPWVNVKTQKTFSVEDDPDVMYLSKEDQLDKVIREVQLKAYHLYCEKTGLLPSTTKNSNSAFRFNRYRSTNVANMKPHWDNVYSIFEDGAGGLPLLSCIIALNADYEGGEINFYLNNNRETPDEQIKLDKGDIILWPSSFMFSHSIAAVRSGTRYSIVNWLY